MRWVIQRVHSASVSVNGDVVGAINQGLCILVGVSHDDTEQDVDWLVRKVVGMRIFSDTASKMNWDIQHIQGSILLISQFTLHAQTAKGNRPSFILAARPEQAERLYNYANIQLQIALSKPCECGVFGADMQIQMQLDGPVTILMDSKDRV